ncbi:ABC transporter permease [Desulfuromonas acetexigens]|uniref:ABC transporter permease n=1 Tax=Trichloromonas acetexigens TaxID=38815 RepID=A0A550JKM8_9BACT|nr:ABC transporter permease [Desulfuromonas acetexigens]TRO83774.1 ABC transporter permease [Desulfuromonas acetexigens]
MTISETIDNPPDLIRLTDDTLHLRLAGDWLAGSLPLTLREVEDALSGKTPGSIRFETKDLQTWDSGLLTFLIALKKLCDAREIAFDDGNLPDGARRLLALASAVPEQQAGKGSSRAPLLERVADRALAAWKSVVDMLDFLGEVTLACGRLLTGRARFRRSDLWAIMRECGADALPIVSLISALVGLIFAFVGAVQLSMFGAEIYVASLVAIAVVRVMGAIMTGIIMAGRTGAAFAARIGTMQVNEEIDALATLGISPIDFLVLPRIIALVVMMPLLCLYADLMGILGGLAVGVFMLDLNLGEYLEMTKLAVGLKDFWIGLFHSAVFGVLVALSGCLRGLQCGRSASAVGDAATSAVVTGIVNIIVATAVITVICNILGI